MRVIRLFAENLLNLRAVSIEPTDRVMRITGANGAGKSSVLNAIFYALTGKKGQAPEPVRRGTRRATVRLELGEGTETELVVTLRITEHSQSLDVESADGRLFRTPTKMLEKIIGSLTFDPHAFSRMHPKQRLQTLRELVAPEVDVDQLDKDNERDYALRTEWNHKVNSFKERVHTLGLEIDESIDVVPIELERLTREMAQASEHNGVIERQTFAREQRRLNLSSKRLAVTDKRAMAERLLSEADVFQREANDEQAALDAAEPLGQLINVQALRAEVDAAIQENMRRDAERDRREGFEFAKRELEVARETSQRLTDAMKTRDEQKAAAIAAMKMPIDGLGFGNGDVTYKDLPYEQASTGQQLRIATAIGMALNPRLRILCVRDGSLLDANSKNILEQMAEEHDFQLWIEATQDDPTVGIHIVDGSIAAIDGIPVDAELEAPV
jgi:ABC-type lipoprotein export system ATPase subunit